MPKFKVCLQQYVEQIAVVHVEAADADEARGKALATDPGETANWGPGNDIDDLECFAIVDENGKTVWKR